MGEQRSHKDPVRVFFFGLFENVSVIRVTSVRNIKQIFQFEIYLSRFIEFKMIN